MKKPIPIVFFGNDWRSALVLEELLKNSQIKVEAIICLPDKPQGRQKKPLVGPVRQIAINRKIPIFNLDNFSSLKKQISPLPQSAILASFGAKIAQEVIDTFPFGILVIHPSLLPLYRGVSPIQRTILNGDQKTGVTVLKMDDKFDHGPILGTKEIKLTGKETTPDLTKKLFLLGAQLSTSILPRYLAGKITPQPQDHALATRAPKIIKEDGQINWRENPQKIERQIRALAGWPGTWTYVKLKTKKRLKVLEAHLEKGKLVLDQVQLEG
ncbi:methionyl-tRNA formyltransferase, partial [Patescibacteria group bacterium]